jgi:hypothetical protein
VPMPRGKEKSFLETGKKAGFSLLAKQARAQAVGSIKAAGRSWLPTCSLLLSGKGFRREG